MAISFICVAKTLVIKSKKNIKTLIDSSFNLIVRIKEAISVPRLKFILLEYFFDKN
ncbi:hypothetical protein GYL95_001541 [Campylobacter coli]|uniref:Uncharacterized protein n=1 Tax=Campylobacter coli TaxID=195 RepID=A0A6C8DVM9_CAMCO|nr:hypothetical protein [Campylobacter coli]EDP4384804.1 hypothetical protein [Campylobacter jejuni]EDO7970363.1 hypothetical protein [Campylobacter coli]EDO7971939.1 hypothetical protein [Campylobacter coli]EDO7978859.1 hypothetical protein [Campylobacter coli]